MSNLRPESHVAQQIRRDKLRINNASSHHSHEFPNNLEHLSSHQGFNLDLLQVRNVRNANMLDGETNLYYTSQIPNLLSSRNVNPLEYDHSHEAGSSEFGFHSSSQKEQCDFGNWKNNNSSNLQQGTDWVVNYGSSSAIDRINTNSFLNAEPNNVSASSQSFHHKPHSTFNELTDAAQLNHPSPSVSYPILISPVYHNALQLQNVSSQGGTDMASLMNPIWVGEPSELHFGYGNRNPEILSLSLSSKSNFQEGSGSASEDLQSSKQTTKSVSRDCGKSVQENVEVNIPLKSSSYRDVGPLGPFTGYATILKSSRFLRSAQQLLDEFCCLSGSKFAKDVSASTSVDTLKGSNLGSSSSMFNVSNENSSDWGAGSGIIGGSSRLNYQQKKARLLYMQEEVARQYKQYHQQMQMVVSSFESVAGLSSATPYISLALKSVSKHFKCLKNSISDQLKLIGEALGEDLSSVPSNSTSSKADTNMARLRCLDQSFQNNKSGRGTLEQHVWRPQRGLPERSVAILKAWLFEHFLHPYPTDTDKHMLATQTGLSRNQVSNWFINARVRVWKPMVEEIHMLETKTTGTKENGTEGSSSQPRVDKNLNKFGLHSIPENHFQSMELDSSSVAANVEESGEQWSQEKRSKLECEMSSSMDGALMGFVPYRSGGLGSVSLTLGLRHGVEGVQHQQNLQDEQLRCHLGGHMIHDFVG